MCFDFPSPNGNQFAAITLNRSLGLTAEKGVSMLDAYSDLALSDVPRSGRPTNSRWVAIADKFNQTFLDEQEYQRCLEGANYMFALMDKTATAAMELEANRT